ncbi:MAG TPA: YCF48-related protein [Gammaproteobacteria bacterium]|nr:YCF48-related protein [Gammaproteobacteria bacterium]
MMFNRAVRRPLAAIGNTLILAAIATPALAAREEVVDRRTPLVIDFMDGDYLASLDGILVAGPHGLIGTLKFGEEGVELKQLEGGGLTDFTALEKVDDKTVLLGSSTGHLYSFIDGKLTDLGKITEYDEPVLDIAVSGTKGWAVGARGMLARSDDLQKWETVTISEVTQPPIALPANTASEWYFGVSNLVMDSVQFTATKGGQPPVVDTDYTIYPDEGFMQVMSDLDTDPAPTITFKFAPGPAFRAGDVSWNVVMFEGDNVTIAGEFGMVLQSTDNGGNWVRRDAVITPKEPEPPYWIAGAREGNTMLLAGAAGAIRRSTDGGMTWETLPAPSAEAIFGVSVLDGGKPAIAGAVGMMGTLEDGKWKLADRSALQLLSWLRTPVEMPDGSLVILGGRSTVIRMKDGELSRVPVKRMN